MCVCELQDVSVTITTCDSSFDTELGLFFSNLTLIANNDDEFFSGPCTGSSQSALENVNLMAGVTYLIVVVRKESVMAGEAIAAMAR